MDGESRAGPSVWSKLQTILFGCGKLPLLIVTAAAAPHLQLGSIVGQTTGIQAKSVGDIDDLVIPAANTADGPLLIVAAAALPLTNGGTIAAVPERIY